MRRRWPLHGEVSRRQIFTMFASVTLGLPLGGKASTPEASTMSTPVQPVHPLFGPISQIAYVARDVRKALEYWTHTLGVGPFFLFPVPLALEWLEINGRRVANDYDFLSVVALSYVGDLQIELIQPGSAPSPFREFLSTGHSGVQHLGVVATDYDAQMAAARGAGIAVAAEGRLPISRFAFLQTDASTPGTMIELVEQTQTMRELFEQIRAATSTWDGTDPVRKFRR